MQILITIAIAAPLVVLACWLKAAKHTKVDNCPTALRSSSMDINGPDRAWGVK